jgi:hypothetical protein
MSEKLAELGARLALSVDGAKATDVLDALVEFTAFSICRSAANSGHVERMMQIFAEKLEESARDLFPAMQEFLRQGRH